MSGQLVATVTVSGLVNSSPFQATVSVVVNEPNSAQAQTDLTAIKAFFTNAGLTVLTAQGSYTETTVAVS